MTVIRIANGNKSATAFQKNIKAKMHAFKNT
jgi:hypothetical protein